MIIDALMDSSVNSGNSLRQSRKVMTSSANPSSCSGKDSTSTSSFNPGDATCADAFCFRRGRKCVLISSSRDRRWTLRGNKSAAFSRNRWRMRTRRSRRWNDDDRIPTELPSCRAELAKFLSCAYTRHSRVCSENRRGSYLAV